MLLTDKTRILRVQVGDVMGRVASAFARFLLKAIVFVGLLFNMAHFSNAAPTWSTSGSSKVNYGTSTMKLDIDRDGTPDARFTITTSVNNNSKWDNHNTSVSFSENDFVFTYFSRHHTRSDAPYLYQSIATTAVSTAGSNLDMGGVKFQPIVGVKSNNNLRHWQITWSPGTMAEGIVNSPYQPNPSKNRNTQTNSAGVIRRIRLNYTVSCARLPAGVTFNHRDRHYYYFQKLSANSDNAKVGGQELYAKFQIPVDLSVKKVNSGGNQGLVPGEVGYYDLYLTNSASALSAGVNIKLMDDWSSAAGLQFIRAEEISAIGAAGSYWVNGTTGTWKVPNIRVGETRQMRVYFRVKATASAGSYSTTVSNAADMPNVQQDSVADTCNSNPSGWNTLKVSSGDGRSATATVLTPAATFTKTAWFIKGSDSLGSVGDLIRYKFKVTNTGSTPLDITLSETAFSGSGTLPTPILNASESTNATASTVGVGGTAIFYSDYTTTEADFLAQQAGSAVTNTAKLVYSAQDSDGVIDTSSAIPTQNISDTASVTIPIPTALATERKAVKSGTELVVSSGDKLPICLKWKTQDKRR